MKYKGIIESPVTIAIPPKGRTAIRTIREHEKHGYIPREDADYICRVLQADRKRIDVETEEIVKGKRRGYSTIPEIYTADILCPGDKLGEINGGEDLRGLRKMQDENPVAFSLTASLNLHRTGKPPRILLRNYNTEINGIPVTLVGIDHYYAPYHISSRDVDLAYVGFDEIAATYADRDNPERIKKWPGFNDSDVKGITPVILGSAGLNDYCAHFIIAKDPEAFKGIRFNEGRYMFYCVDFVIADMKYTAIYDCFLRKKGKKRGKPEPTDFRHSGSIEEDIARGYTLVEEEGKVKKIPCERGISIVNEAKRLEEYELSLYRLPVLQSETVVAANQIRLEENEDVQRVAEGLVYNPYNDRGRIKEYVSWYFILVPNTDDRWYNRPTAVEMFIDKFDRAYWARKRKDIVTTGDIEYLQEVQDKLSSKE